MRFYGRLWGCGERADSLFAATERTYDSLCRAAAEARSPRPRLIVDMKQAAAWYVPGADSCLARLYADGGADYVFARHRGSGSVALSVETVMAEGAEAVLLHVATVGGYDAVWDWFERRGLGAEVARGSLFDIFGDTVFDDVA